MPEEWILGTICSDSSVLGKSCGESWFLDLEAGALSCSAVMMRSAYEPLLALRSVDNCFGVADVDPFC